MTYEEIMVKLGMDGSSLSRGVRQLKDEMGELSAHGHKGFVHMQSSGKAFHKLLEQLKETSPGAALGLQAIFTPVTGAIAGATMVLAYFNNKLEEMNAEMDKASTENLKPMADAWAQGRELAAEMNDSIRDQMKWLREQKELHNDVLDTMKDQLANAKAQHEIDGKKVMTKKEHLALETKDAQAALDLAKGTERTLKWQKEGAMTSEKIAASAYIEAPEHELVIKEKENAKQLKESLDKATTERNALKVASAKATPADLEGFRLLPSWQEIKDMAGGLTGQKGLDERLKESEEKVNADTRNYHKATSALETFQDKLKDLKDGMEAARAAATKAAAAHYSVAVTVRDQENELKKAQAAQAQAAGRGAQLNPYAPTLEEFGASQGPFGNLARSILRTRQGIHDSLLSGNMTGAANNLNWLKGQDVTDYLSPAEAKVRGLTGETIGLNDKNWSHRGFVAVKRHEKGLEDQWQDAMKNFFGDGGVPVKIMEVSE